MTTANKVKVTKDITKVIIRNESNTHISRAGLEDLGETQTLVAISFNSNMPQVNYSVVATMQNTADTFPQMIPVTVSAKSISGFTVKWDIPLDSGNYKLAWIVSEPNNP